MKTGTSTQTITLRTRTSSGWSVREETDLGEVGRAIDSADLVWLDLEGTPDLFVQVLKGLVASSKALDGIDAQRAARGGESPPQYPPKAKAFRDFVFARPYWLGMEEETLVAQEVHVVAGSTFAITMRYAPVALDLEAAKLQATPYEGDMELLTIEGLETTFDDQRERLAGSGDEMIFGLELAAALLDTVVDSLFDTLDSLRSIADELEGDALRTNQSRPTARRGQGTSDLEQRMLGLRRLLRQVRWAFLPSDEIAEFLSGPFIGIDRRSEGLAFRFRDLRREADRAVETARDVTDQVQYAVGMVNTMKADRLNSTMYVLTVVATVLLVPTLIAGIYGMNFQHMPELGFRFGYWFTLGAMAVFGYVAWWAMQRYLRR